MRQIGVTLSIVLIAIFISGCSTAPEDNTSTLHRQQAKDRSFVDAEIDKAVAKGVFPFLYVRVEKLDGSVVYEHSAVNPEFTNRVPTGDSWLRLWSMSKSVTIAAILSLEEDGVLHRSDPVTDYIPEFADLMVLSSKSEDASCQTDIRSPARAITIEDLLNHNDGFYYPFTDYPCINDAINQARLPEATSTAE